MNCYQTILNEMEHTACLALQRSWKNDQGDLKDMASGLVTAEQASETGREAMEKGMPVCLQKEDRWEMAEPFFPKERLIVLGGGHVALPVTEFGAKVGFSVTVVDDRPSFANTERFPWAKEVICDEFSHALDQLKIKESDYVAIITRGHRHDADCLRMICKGTEPAYLGMIGSRKRVAIVKETLLSEGCDEGVLSRLKSPIGLNIGGVTPEEIAISVIAEVIAVKRLARADKRLNNQSDLDLDVVKVLAEETSEPKSVVTVMSSKGSVPRGAGAKMIVYPDGRIKGSIGGGCSEAAVLSEARWLIGTGKFQVVHVDLTGDAAEDEGMVCGGIMDVLIEDYMVS